MVEVINVEDMGAKMKVHLVLKEEMLGTASGNAAIHEEFIASKAPDAKSMEEEIEALGIDEVVEKGKTVFARNEAGAPIMWNYQIEGFFKDACASMAKLPNTKSSKIKAYKKKVDQHIFVSPRKVEIVMPEGSEIGSCQRSLRADTMQGPRTALANSETVPEGSVLDFEIHCMDEKDIPLVLEWLNYGAMRGLGQWRNSGKGKFLFSASDAETGELLFSNIRS